VFNYYDGLFAKVVTDDWESDLFAYDTGVFQGCTYSTILFNTVFNLLSEWLKNVEVEGFKIKQEDEEDIEAREQCFADDLTIVTEGPDENQILLDAVDEFLAWTACMKAKPSKCRSLALTTFTPRSPERLSISSKTSRSSISGGKYSGSSTSHSSRRTRRRA
jgi:hypothetical protein